MYMMMIKQNSQQPQQMMWGGEAMFIRNDDKAGHSFIGWSYLQSGAKDNNVSRGLKPGLTIDLNRNLCIGPDLDVATLQWYQLKTWVKDTTCLWVKQISLDQVKPLLHLVISELNLRLAFV